jgi:hypothetical protein
MGDSRTLKCNVPFMNKLRDIVASGVLGIPAHLLVRVSPKDNYELYRHLENDAYATIVYPKGTLEPGLGRWLPDEDEDIGRTNQLAHASVVVCVSSTLILDACCMGKPVVNLAYDAGETRPYGDSVARFFDYTHALPVIEEGGTWIVKNDQELIAAVGTYLRDEGLHRDRRRKMLRRIVKYDDGLSYRRWAKAILDIAGHK